jgi:hypothetical protein
MIQTKFGFHWFSTFRGEDFLKSLRRTTTTGDGNSSHDPSGELKRINPQSPMATVLSKWQLIFMLRKYLSRV